MSDEQLTRLAGRLTDRDRRVELDCYEHRLLTTEQLRRLHFTTPRKARSRLAELYGLRVLDRFRPAWQQGEGSTPHHWTLDVAGAHVVAAILGITRAELHWTREPAAKLAASSIREHLTAINEFATRLAEEARDAGGALSEWLGERGTHDCMALLDRLESGSVDAVVTDPPYGIDFQHAAWDGCAIEATAARLEGRRLTTSEAFEVFSREWARRCLRVLRPGGHLVGFGAPRTAHRLACALADAGFELRDTLMWLFGEGLPKSRRLPEGRGTSLKPAYEPILLARKAPEGTIARNLREHGTGALEIDACGGRRWPSNVVASHARRCDQTACVEGCAAAALDERAGRPVSRFFYCPKARHGERDAGCEQLPARTRDLFPNAGKAGSRAPRLHNPHPTVKPLELMRWLVRLTCPPGGLVLDCFCGSGSSGVAAVLEYRRFHGIELDSDYVAIARARITHWQHHAAANRPARREGEVPARPFARTRTGEA